MPILPMLYLKAGLCLVAVLLVAGAYWKISSAFAERDELRESVKVAQAQVQMYQESMARDAKTREDINDAISKIKVTSNIQVKQIDTAPQDPVDDGAVVQLVPSGVPQVPGVSTFTNVSTGSGSAVATTR